MFLPSVDELERLKQGILAAFAFPLIDDIEDYVWEAIFAYVKGLPLVDPLTHTRSKQLFDLIDLERKIGWSAKALRCRIAPEVEFELVIQRADILKKQRSLGFQGLSLDSPPAELGAAILTHWYGTKVQPDAEQQGIVDKRICILLKSRNLQRYALYEDQLSIYQTTDLIWEWTDESHSGLQGLRRDNGFCVFRWYPNQKQLFERFRIPIDCPIVELRPQRLPIERAIQELVNLLNTP